MRSFSEIDTTAKRASKAAGFSWGIAEEVGKSIRSLELFGLPGIINLNNYLKKIKQKHPKKIEKIEKENKTSDKELCPIYSGVAFLDRCLELEKLKSEKVAVIAEDLDDVVVQLNSLIDNHLFSEELSRQSLEKFKKSGCESLADKILGM